MARYRTAFYEPLVAEWSNFGNWTQSGSKTASERATGVWKRALADFVPPASAVATSGVLDEFIARRTEEGGAAPGVVTTVGIAVCAEPASLPGIHGNGQRRTTWDSTSITNRLKS